MASSLSLSKQITFSVVAIFFAVLAAVLIAELVMRFASPIPYMYPRYKFSPQYGSSLFENRQMVHERPGMWKFLYTTNNYQYRGPSIPISNTYDKWNIVILGDSYSFGMGVNDGEEFAMVMAKELRNEFNIINLGVGGWGLTQEIRRYYEFGQLYAPSLVILAFCNNDPTDNLNNLVTTVENGRFVFHDANNTAHLAKQYLSTSVIQKSQIYNLFRDGAFTFITNRVTNSQIQKLSSSAGDTVPVDQSLYNTLLETFANDLRNKNIPLLLIAVNNELLLFPHIFAKVKELDTQGRLRYYEVVDWLQGLEGYQSPEGHMWGQKAHQIIGEKLAEIIRIDAQKVPRTSPASVNPEARGESPGSGTWVR